MVKSKDTPVHVLLGDHVDVRKHILLSGIDAIKSLELYEGFKKLKNLKRKKFLELNEKLKSISQEVQHLVNNLPQTGERKFVKQINMLDHKQELTKEKPMKDDKIKDLHREMRSIEEKLSRLNF